MNARYRLFHLPPITREKIGGCVLLALVLWIMWFLLIVGGR